LPDLDALPAGLDQHRASFLCVLYHARLSTISEQLSTPRDGIFRDHLTKRTAVDVPNTERDETARGKVPIFRLGRFRR